jgi:hypothetical protein
MQSLIRTCAAVPALLGLLALAASQMAHAADAAVKGEVLVILAKESGGGYDPKLKKMPALQKPPFNGFKSMAILSTTSIELGASKDATIALPNDRTLQLKLLERLADGRHKVQVSISRPGKDDPPTSLTVIASSEPFFVAGQSHAGGTLVIGVRVGGPDEK